MHGEPARLLIVIAAVASMVASAVARFSSLATDPVRLLVNAGAVESRDVEPRLSGGFRWAPYQQKKAAGPVAADRVALLRAAADLARIGQQSPSSTVRHANALARILTGNPRGALAALEPLEAGAGPQVSNDVAAAQYMLAVRDGDASRLQRALVAVDAALQSAPDFAEARFNRALIIEALGLRDLARAEWQSYLRIDPASEWSTEARAHLGALSPEEDFNDALKREYARLAADPAAAHAFAAQHRQRVRLWAEAEILGDWASAMKNHAPEEAARHLRVARELGIGLARDDGDRMLSALVEAIDGADAARRSILIDAHLHFRDGMRAFRDRRPNDAKPLLIAAEQEFARLRAPGALRARHFIASSLFVEGKIAESDRKMRELLATLTPAFPAERADALWIVASAAVSDGRWSDVIEAWSECLAIYERLGEVSNAAVIRQQLVFTFDRLGDRSRAWVHRMTALRQLGRQLTTRQQEAIGSVVRAAMMDRDWRTALSFARLEVEVGRRVDRPTMLVESLLYRAEVNARLDDRSNAVADLAEARRHLTRITDASLREGSSVIAGFVEASITSDPRVSVELLTKAIDYHSTKGRRMYLPDLLRRRGRAFRVLDDDARAAADFEEGIAELERHRASATPGQDRWSVFHAAHELFGEAIAVALERGDVQTAFDYSERARARGLLDTVQSPWRSIVPADVPPSTTVIEYSIHGDSLFIFVLDDRGVRVRQETIDRHSLDAAIAELNEAGRGSAPPRFHDAARAVYAKVIAPIENELIGRATLAIVPDPAMQPLPFAALADGANRHLIEKHAVTVVPSAAFFAASRNRPRGEEAQSVLVVAGDDRDGPLAAVDREARAVAALYPKAVLLERDRGTRDTFVRHAREARTIHFSGHGVASTDAGGGSYLVLSQDGDDGRLDVKEIASMVLPRTSLVVLAACDTAGGEVRSSEGTISVARAFLAAGVPSVIATIWPIDDEAAAEFFPALHRKLAQGMPARDALRATQIEWIHRRGDSALWASIEVVGQ